MALVLHVPTRSGEQEHVHLADDAGNTYQDTLANFALDHGSAFPALPDDNIGREYEAGVRHFVYNGAFEMEELELTWAEGDILIAAVVALNATKEARLAPPEPVLTLEEVKAEAHEDIDRAAEGVRQKYITRGPGQAMVYLEKSEEAADYVAAGYPTDLSSYPFIQAEVTATGITATEAADGILARKSAWIAIGAAIEQTRLNGKKGVTDATDEAIVEIVRTNILAELETL